MRTIRGAGHEARFDGAFNDYDLNLEAGDEGPILTFTRLGPTAEITSVVSVETFVFADQTLLLEELLEPIAADDAFEIDEDETLVVGAAAGVLANDINLDDGSLQPS